MNSKSHFLEDAFISYGHIDNRLLDDQGKGWVDNFHERLAYRLGELLGYEVKIWRDPRLPGNAYFADVLEDRIEHTLILISVLSPGYLQSEWCRGELREFCRLATQYGGLQIAERLRIFKVVKTHIERDQHPPEFQGQLGYEFYEMDQARKQPGEFGQELGRGKDQRYWDKVNDLAWDIKEVLVNAKLSPGTPSGGVVKEGPPFAPVPPSNGAVYLAETSYDLKQERDKIQRELQQRGHAILPDKEIPYRSPDYEDAVRECLSRCKLSIHLIGESYGIIPEGADNRSIVRLQSELAAERSRAPGFARLIWMPVGLKPREGWQSQFIESLRSSSDLQKGAELLQTTLEELKTVIQVKLSSNGHKRPAKSGPVRKKIYLICDQRDVEGVVPLNDYLVEKGYEVLLPLLEEDGAAESQAIEIHKENLTECDAVLIYYGSANQLWFDYNRRALAKIAGYERPKPLLATGIYVTAPPTNHKRLFNTPEAVVRKNFGAFSPGDLDEFLGEIGA